MNSDGGLPDNGPMNFRWIPAVMAALLLTGCAPDRTLDTLVTGRALAVVLVEHPDLIAAALGTPGPEVPWASLDPSRPWAVTVEPADPPGFRLIVALGKAPGAWAAVQAWARDRGGLQANLADGYAVLSSPGLPALAPASAGGGYDLSALRREGDPIALAVNVGALRSMPQLPEALRPAWLASGPGEDLAGLMMGLSPRDGGLELKLLTQWKPGSPTAERLGGWVPGPSAAGWAPALPPGGGVAAAGTLPQGLLVSLAGLWTDPALRARWRGLAPSLGPRWSLGLSPRADGTVAWSAAVESSDPQAVRQALKALVAGGVVQKQAAFGVLDPDLPVIFQDRRDGLGGVETTLTVGSTQLLIGYGSDRVAVADGAGKAAAVRQGRRAPDTPAPWAAQAPAGALVLAAGRWDGLEASGDLSVRKDGNLDLRLRVDRAALKAWEDRLPQVLIRWVSGEGGWTRFEP